MGHELALAIFHRDIILVEDDSALISKFLQEEIQIIADQCIVSEIDAHLLDVVAVDACITREVIVAGVECHKVGSLAGAEESGIIYSLEYIIPHRDVSTLSTTPQHTHASGFTVSRIVHGAIHDLVTLNQKISAMNTQERVSAAATGIDDHILIPDGIVQDANGIRAGTVIMHFNILMVEPVVTLDGSVDNLIVLNRDILMPVGRIEADKDATGGHFIDIELVVP